MATPHVAGVAGLLWMYFPECKNYQIRNVLAAPAPQCSSDSECDDGDVCTADTCENGLCQNEPDCGFCGKSKVDVQITIDNYGGETTYNIKDSSDNKVMEGSGWPANSVNSFWKCFDSGSYKFTITDGYGDGICCNYGQGGYSVKVDDKEVASGGQFGSSETKPFNVGSSAAPVSPPTSPTPDAPTMYPTQKAPTMYPTHVAPTMYPTAAADPVPTPYPTDVPPTTCGEKGASCTKHDQCCGKKCNLKKNTCRK